MRDDFAALDFLSAGGFHGSSSLVVAKKPKKKAFFGFPRRQNSSKAKRPLAALLPILAAKVKKPRGKRSLQGWPIALSWPDSDSAGHRDTDIH